MKLGNIVTVTSIKNQVGKTFAIRNMAGALAEEGKKILILDFTKNTSDYIDFFRFKKYSDLSKVYLGELSLQSVKLIYPENRGISIIANKTEDEFTKEFTLDFLQKVKKTYDYIFVELPTIIKNPNIEYIAQEANQNIIVIEQELSSIKEINKLIKKYKHIENHSVLVNKFDFQSSDHSGLLIDLEDLFKIIDSKFVGVVEKVTQKKILKEPSFLTPHTNLHLSFNRISKRIIENKYLDKISNISLQNSFSMEILYKKFDIIEKKSF